MAMIITDDQNYKDIAEAIREKNGEEMQYKPNEMANAVRALSSLNFEVVGGTSQPENPKENTIWVNTDYEVTTWSLCANEPIEPVQGMVWLRTHYTGMTCISIVKNNDIHVYPINAKQYKNGVWENIESQIYQNGTWSNITIQFNVLKDGSYNASVVGNPSFVGTCSFTNGAIVASAYDTSKGNYCYFNTPIDVSLYNTLRMHVNFTSKYTSNYFCVGLKKSAITVSTYSTNLNDMAAQVTPTSTGSQWVNVDISEVEGQYYIATIGVAGYTVDEIILTSEILV